ADADPALAVPQSHCFGRRARQQSGNTSERHFPPIVPFGEHHWEECFKSWAAGRSLPDSTVLRRYVAMHMIGRDSIDVARKNAGPQRLAILALAQRRIDLAHFAAFPIDIVSEVMRTRFDDDVGAGIAAPEPRFHCLCR